MHRSNASPVKVALIPEAQGRLDEAIRTRLLPQDELEPSVLQQLAGHPDEVQRNVIDRFLTTGLSYDVQNKTGWLVGILKRELKAFHEAARFRCLEPGVAKKLESALRTKRLRPEEFPSEVIEILTKRSAQEQHAAIDKFLQLHGTTSIQTPMQGTNQHGPPVPFSTAREELYEIIGSQLGHHLFYQTQFAYSYSQNKEALRGTHRVNLQQQLRLHDDVIDMLVQSGDQELYEKLTLVGNLPPNYLNADAVWASLNETSVDEQMRILKEFMTVHREHASDNDGSRFQIEKKREDFRIAVERIMMSYGFHNFGGRSQLSQLTCKIIDDGFATRFDLSNLRITNDEWKQELSSASKRLLKQFMRGKSPALCIDFNNSTVGNVGDHLLEFFSRHKPIMDVSLVSLNLIDTDIVSEHAWNSLANFLLTLPARELELTASNISSLALGVLVQTMSDGEFPQYAPFYELDVEPPRLAICLPNNTSIRFPPSDEPWVQQWLTAGHMMIEAETIRQVQLVYQQLQASVQEPWSDAMLWSHNSTDAYKSSGNDRYSSRYSATTTDTHYNPSQYDMPYSAYGAYKYPKLDPRDCGRTYAGFAYDSLSAYYEAPSSDRSKWNEAMLQGGTLPTHMKSGEGSTYEDFGYRREYPMKAPPPASYLGPASYASESMSPVSDTAADTGKWNLDMLQNGASATPWHAEWMSKGSTVENGSQQNGSPLFRDSKAPPPAPMSIALYLGGNMPTMPAGPTFPVIVDARAVVASPDAPKKAKNKIPKDFLLDNMRICTAVI